MRHWKHKLCLALFTLKLSACSSTTQILLDRLKVLEAEKGQSEGKLAALYTRMSVLTKELEGKETDVRILNLANYQETQKKDELTKQVASTIQQRDAAMNELIIEKERHRKQLDADKAQLRKELTEELQAEQERLKQLELFKAYMCGRLSFKYKNKTIEPCVTYQRDFQNMNNKLQQKKQNNTEQQPQLHPRQRPSGTS